MDFKSPAFEPPAFESPVDVSQFSFDSIPVSLDTILWGGFALGLVAYVVMALIYHHHWSYYGITLPQKLFAVVVFNGGALVLLTTVALLASALGTM